jgi:hypothetical protein
MQQRRFVSASLLIACLCAGGTMRPTCFAQKAAVPRQPDTVAIASDKVKELLVLMDTDKNGKISRQAWIKFMEAEFDRLDAQKKGEIDPKELLRSTGSAQHVRTADLGK